MFWIWVWTIYTFNNRLPKLLSKSIRFYNGELITTSSSSSSELTLNSSKSSSFNVCCELLNSVPYCISSSLADWVFWAIWINGARVRSWNFWSIMSTMNEWELWWECCWMRRLNLTKSMTRLRLLFSQKQCSA
jgi:hypothetical protein